MRSSIDPWLALNPPYPTSTLPSSFSSSSFDASVTIISEVGKLAFAPITVVPEWTFVRVEQSGQAVHYFLFFGMVTLLYVLL